MLLTGNEGTGSLGPHVSRTNVQNGVLEGLYVGSPSYPRSSEGWVRRGRLVLVPPSWTWTRDLGVGGDGKEENLPRFTFPTLTYTHTHRRHT